MTTNVNKDKIAQKLERGWQNSSVADTRPRNKYLKKIDPRATKAIQNLILRYDLPSKTPQSTSSGEPSAFDSIASALGFVHHKGTDKNVELKVIKLILKRESAIQSLYDMCTSKSKEYYELQNSTKTGILDRMLAIRNMTVEVIEMICLWRTTMVGALAENPRPFIWEGKNYILTMVNDLDFLSRVNGLIEIIGVSAEKLVHNPLMLPETLKVEKLNKHPHEWALKDTNDVSEGEAYELRLQLRKVEHIILQEIQFNSRGDNSVQWADSKNNSSSFGPATESFSITNSSYNGNNPNAALMNKMYEDQNDEKQDNIRRNEVLDWYETAQTQLYALEKYRGEMLNMDHVSTNRLNTPSIRTSKDYNTDFVPLAKYTHSPLRLNDPTSLTQIASLWKEERVAYEYFDENVSPSDAISKHRSRAHGNRSDQVKSAGSVEGTSHSTFQRVVITEVMLREVISIKDPHKSVVLAGAAILIIVANGNQVSYMPPPPPPAHTHIYISNKFKFPLQSLQNYI